ncbi:MAG: hypothetical protein ACU837_07800 [Gammaproteobacteria bacterium]
MAKRKTKLNFDAPNGVVVLSREMVDSPAYAALSNNAKALMIELQKHWQNDQPIGFGVREAAEKLHIRQNTACIVFKELIQWGFIECVDEALFNSKRGSKAREWRITWMPYMDKKPTHDWRKFSGNQAPTELELQKKRRVRIKKSP